jgi:acyl-CoA thioesterase-1
MCMNWIVYLFGSGAAFFAGAGLVLAGVALAAFGRRPWMQRRASSAALFGLVFIALSATPLPYWFYAVAAAGTLGWLVAEGSKREWLRRRRVLFRAAAAALWLAGVALELPYHFLPAVPAAADPRLYLIGDSVSAGLGEAGVETWPRRLARSRAIVVTDFSQAAATTASALRQADRLPAEGGTVLVEIGGNDLLGSTSAAQFEHDLERLLARVCVPGRVVVMFELPLPPLHNEYGRAQRRLAAAYGVLLIPKRVLLAVLTADGATLDSIHLTPAGHERMAEAVGSLLRPESGD